MPGAYEKQMCGEHYESIERVVDTCQRYLKDEAYEALRLEIPLLLLLQGDQSKKTLEEFCYGGGFRFMCSLLQQRAINPLIGDVSPVLNSFSALLAIEFDPFDDDLGRLPLLTYFLCERHTHYVDIHWSCEDLQLMKEFILGHLSILSSIDTVTELDRITAVNNLYGALLSYPPYRVVPSAACLFTKDACSNLLDALSQLPSLWDTSFGRKRIMQLLLSIASFGLGLVIVADIPHSQLLLTVSRQLVPELRCACTRCEFFRRLQRAAKERDEFGVAKASEAKKAICSALIEADVVVFIVKFFTKIQDAFNKSKTATSLNRLLLSEALRDREQSPNSEGNTSSGPSGATAEEANLSTGNIRAEHVTSISMDEKRMTNMQSSQRRCGENDPLLDDQAKVLALQLVWLCSWACEDIHHSSILSLSDFALTTTLLKSLDLSDLRYVFNSSTGEFIPGEQTTIETLCTLALRAEDEELKNLTSRIRPTVEALLQRCCIQFVESCDHLSRNWTPSMSKFAPVISSMLTCVYVASFQESIESPCNRIPRGRQRAPDTFSSVLSVASITACADACRCLVDGYEWAGCEMDERVFITSVLQSMAVLTGRLEYARCTEARRRLLPPPHQSCGFMATAGRWLLNKFDTSVANGEGCVIIRTLGSLVISRAEKAAALQLAPQN